GLANALLYHAATRLPGPTPPRWAWPALGIVIYALGTSAVIVSGASSTVLWWTDAGQASRLLLTWPTWFALGAPLRVFTEMFASAALMIVLGWKFAHVRQAEERRRLRWLFTGCIVATVPFLLYKAVETFVIANDPAAMRDSPLRAIVNIAQVLAPISLAYAIL